jgi:dGTPase
LDEDLAEAVALAHDLGHTPFGHAGEEALSAATAAAGGFDHNAHALRLVTELEHRYAAFDGLNLTWESLEGLVKHNGPIGLDGRSPAQPIARFDTLWSLDLGDWPGMEAQAAALADDIAYVNHDIDDGLRAGIFSVDELCEAPMAGVHVSEVRNLGSRFELGRFIGELVHRLMNQLVGDVLTESNARLRAGRPSSVAAARKHGRPFVSFSAGTEAEVTALKAFLYDHMYRHPRVLEAMGRAKVVVSDLCRAFVDNPSLMPSDWTERCGTSGDTTTLSVVRDYIAGMTDRYALLEHARITHTEITI